MRKKMRLEEGKDFEMLPWVENQEPVWAVKLIDGPYDQTVFRFENVRLENDNLKFAIDLLENPKSIDITEEIALQAMAGDVLYTLIDEMSTKRQDEPTTDNHKKPSNK